MTSNGKANRSQFVTGSRGGTEIETGSYFLAGTVDPEADKNFRAKDSVKTGGDLE